MKPIHPDAGSRSITIRAKPHVLRKLMAIRAKLRRENLLHERPTITQLIYHVVQVCYEWHGLHTRERSARRKSRPKRPA